MSASLITHASRRETPPTGVILEVRYTENEISFAFWDGRHWRPHYRLMTPLAWRHIVREPGCEPDSWHLAPDVLD